MKRLLTVVGLAALLCGALFFVLSPANGQDVTWTQVFDQSAFNFGQVDPTVPDSMVGDWNQGILTIDDQKLQNDGFTGQYLQVLEFDDNASPDFGYWIVQNFLIQDPLLLPNNGETFTFNKPLGGPIGAFTAGVFVTRTAQPPGPKNPRRTPGGGMPQRPQLPVKQIPVIISPGLLGPPAATMPVASIMAIDPTQPDTTNNPLPNPNTTNGNPDNVNQARYQCAPASVSNSLQYLGVNDGKTNIPSTDPMAKQNSRVLALDAAMKRNKDQGVSSLNMIQGKLAYINQVPLNLVVRHQGKFCPDNTGKNCQMGVITDGKNPPGMVA